MSLLKSKTCSPLLNFVRHGHWLRGKAPGVALSLEQRLQNEKREDPILSKRNDIGFPLLKPSRSAEVRQRLDHIKAQRKNMELEKLSRSNQLKIDLEEAKKDYLNTAGPFHIRKVADHYGVFEHLFGKHAYFTPRVAMDIMFEISEDVLCPVYHGNRVKPSDATKEPSVKFDHNFSVSRDPKDSKDSLWTLVLTNPDGNFKEQDKECLHWMIGNIPNGNLAQGDLIVPYLQPIPPRGTGYHRHIFVLYKQEKKLDFTNFKVTEPFNLEKRTFNTYDFYKGFQDDMTPAGLSFFQADWDSSLTNVYHKVLNMKEPVYEYDWPKVILKDQKQFPHREAFNLYLDRYADPHDVNKRYIEEKLSKTHPFDGPEPRPRFPNAIPFEGYLPSWLKTDVRKRRLGMGRVNDVNKWNN